MRRQVAEKESFGIEPPASSKDPFLIRSAASGREYRVRYFGPESKFNRCECMDFKTNRLGTCKHIEAITKTAKGKFTRKDNAGLLNTTVYVDYPSLRTIKIRIGDTGTEKMTELAESFFDRQWRLRDTTCDPTDFIRKAREIDPDFEWESDAMNLLIENRDKARRKAIMEGKYAN